MEWGTWDCMTCGKRIRIVRNDDNPGRPAFEVTHGEGEARLTIGEREVAENRHDGAYVGKRISRWLHEVHQYEGRRVCSIAGL